MQIAPSQVSKGIWTYHHSHLNWTYHHLHLNCYSLIVTFRVDFVADRWPAASFSSSRLCKKKLQLHSSYSSSTHNWALHNRIISWHIEQIDWISNYLLLGNWSIIQSANWLITWLGISQFPIRSGTVEFDHEFHPSYPMSLFFVTALIMWDEYQTSALKCQQLRKFQTCFPLGLRLFRDIWGFLWDLQGFLGILRDLWGFSGISRVSWGLKGFSSKLLMWLAADPLT